MHSPAITENIYLWYTTLNIIKRKTMSFCINNIDKKITSYKITIEVNDTHPLIQLANKIDWRKLESIVLPDLKKTTADWQWWLGRKLCLRTHLAVYLLQQLLNSTDRGIENSIKLTPLYQVFCGRTIVKKWHCPDHTRIHSFRSRLSPETQCFLSNEIANLAVKLKFAKPEHIDIDSTIQEPDMQHPSMSNLLVKAAGMARDVQKLLQKRNIKTDAPEIDMKKIKSKARNYFFIKRKKSLKNAAEKDFALKELWKAVTQPVQELLKYQHLLTEPFVFDNLKKHDKKLVNAFVNKVAPFISESYEHNFWHTPMNCKIFSFHRNDVDCFNKGKENKPKEFGRQFQIGRIEGNFIWSIPNHSVRMQDQECVKPMIIGHLNLFQKAIESAGTDKGYYSKDNEKFMLNLGVKDVGLQRPQRKLRDPPNNPITEERLTELINRRSGIEPLIGHMKKRWQLGRSRMKLDETTEASGFAAMLGFNLHQLLRNIGGQVKPNAA